MVVRMRKERTFPSQFGFTATKDSGYALNGSGIAFAVDQTIFLRFPTIIPPGSSIQTALLTLPFTVKTAANAQQSYHLIQMHTSGDSPALIAGEKEYRKRLPTVSYINWNPNWPANASSMQSVLPVVAMLQEVVNRPDYVPGGYVTFMITCVDEMGSDMSLWTNNAFQTSPALEVTFNPPSTPGTYITFNEFENSELRPEVNALESGVPAHPWGQNPYYGTFVDPAASGGTIAVDTSFTRLPGLPTLRFTCGTPDADPQKNTGPMFSILWPSDEPLMMCGWAYVPNVIPTSSLLFYGDPFRSETCRYVTARGRWVRFCTNPLYGLPEDASWVLRFPAFGVKQFQPGWQFWISEVAVIRSDVRQESFNPSVPASLGVRHVASISRQQSYREWKPRTSMLVNGVPTKVRSWSIGEYDVAFPSETLKLGKQIQQLTAGTTIQNLGTNISTSEL